MFQVSNQTKVYTAAGAVAVGIAAYVSPMETAYKIGTPLAIAATFVASKAVYGIYSYFTPKTVKLSTQEVQKSSLEQDLENKENDLEKQVKDMDRELIKAIKESKNPAGLLVDYSNVTKIEKEWLDKFRNEGINDTGMLGKMSATYTKIMEAILPPDKMKEFGAKSLDMLVLAMECNDLRDKIDPTRKANSQKLIQTLQQVNEAVVNPVLVANDTSSRTHVKRLASSRNAENGSSGVIKL